MFSRRRVLILKNCRDDVLREKLNRVASSKARQEAMIKDAHLIEAARETDRIVLSLDERVRALFRDAAVHAAEVRSVMWANPENHEEGVVDWLHGGARRDRTRELGASGRPSRR
jgi:hypothetical protein